MAIDFEKVVSFSNGVRVINATPHLIRFLDGEKVVEVAPCGAKVSAKAVETPLVQKGEAVFVKTVFEQTQEGLSEIEEIAREAPDAIIIGSLISAQAYPGNVFGMTPAPGFERVSTEEKRMSTTKFTIF